MLLLPSSNYSNKSKTKESFWKNNLCVIFSRKKENNEYGPWLWVFRLLLVAFFGTFTSTGYQRMYLLFNDKEMSKEVAYQLDFQDNHRCINYKNDKVLYLSEEVVLVYEPKEEIFKRDVCQIQ